MRTSWHLRLPFVASQVDSREKPKLDLLNKKANQNSDCFVLASKTRTRPSLVNLSVCCGVFLLSIDEPLVDHSRTLFANDICENNNNNNSPALPTEAAIG